MHPAVESLLRSDEPALRYLARARILGEDPASSAMLELREAIKASPLVSGLLAGRDAQGRLPGHPYHKWDGAHWVLVQLADLGYPPGDEHLIPLREQALGWLFSPAHEGNFAKRTVAGRVRMHPSMEGNAVHYLLALGLADGRVDELVERILAWQWPDGGWNCDMNPEARLSSFTETLIPLRALARYHQVSGRISPGVRNANSSESAAFGAFARAAEVFLARRLFRRLSNGRIINHNFTKLHYPPYWHYDILFGLKVMAEAGFIHDPRCAEALDLLESKRLPDGGFPAEAKYYRVTEKRTNGRSPVDWGGTSKRRANPFVTAEALYVLKAAGRLEPGG